MQPLLLESNIIDIFCEQAKLCSKRLALIFRDKSYSYEQLDEITNLIAYNLKMQGVRPNNIIGIYMEKSDNYILSILAILKCGCTYLPMDKLYPSKRISKMIESCGATWVITDEYLDLNHELTFECSIFNYHSLCNSKNTEKQRLENIIDQSLAYIIFTSGSTGEPKGMGIKQSSVINLVNDFINKLESKPGIDHIGLLAPMVFDMSVAQMYYALLNGKTLVLIPDDVKVDANDLLTYFNDKDINFCDFTPQHLRTIVRYLQTKERQYNLPQVILSSGEELPIDLARDYFDIKQNRQKVLFNYYGPTEACVYATSYQITKDSLKSLQQMYIGKPICNTEIYILDSEGSICEEGMVGELCISGYGLANGYINNIELSNKLFVPNPFKKGEIMYKTGDLAKWSSSGNIICLGRRDNQVKIRGYRIELGEIEHHLNQLDGINQAKVLVDREHKSELLMAYYTGDKDLPIDVITSFLKDRLPNYMIPTCCMRIEKFHTNINGKIDIKRLPKFKITDSLIKVHEANTEIVLDDFDRKLLRICQERLGISHIHIDDNFFSVGGDSLLVMHLCIEIDYEWKVNINFYDIYNCQTISDISRLVKARVQENHNEKKQYNEFLIDKVRTSEFQKVVFKMEKRENRKRDRFLLHTYPTYNIVHYIKFNKNMELKRLQIAIEKVVLRQTALRTRFISELQDIYMVLCDTCNDFFEVIEDVDDLSVKSLKSYIRDFIITELPLFKFYAFQNGGEQAFVLNIHHAIFDFYSIQIFLKGLLKFYNGDEIDNRVINFQQRIYSSETENKEKQFEFWRDYYHGREKSAFFIPDLDEDTHIGKNDLFKSTHVAIDGCRLEGIRKISKQVQVSEFILFSSILSLVLAKYSGLGDVSLGTYVPGRKSEDSNVIGLFTKMIGFRFLIDYTWSFSEFITKQNNNFKEILNDQSLMYLDIYRALDYDDLVKGELFSVIFNYVYQISVKDGELVAVADEIGEEPEQMPIGIKAVDRIDQVIFKIKYATRLYSEKYMAVICDELLDFTKLLVDNFESNLSMGAVLGKELELIV